MGSSHGPRPGGRRCGQEADELRRLGRRAAGKQEEQESECVSPVGVVSLGPGAVDRVGGGAGEGFREERVEEGAALDADVNAIAFDALGDGAGVFVDHGGGAIERAVLEVLAELGAKEGVVGALEAARHARQEG